LAFAFHFRMLHQFSQKYANWVSNESLGIVHYRFGHFFS
jgi:hypothetical protein